MDLCYSITYAQGLEISSDNLINNFHVIHSMVIMTATRSIKIYVT